MAKPDGGMEEMREVAGRLEIVPKYGIACTNMGNHMKNSSKAELPLYVAENDEFIFCGWWA
jgi:hypothetical protein